MPICSSGSTYCKLDDFPKKSADLYFFYVQEIAYRRDFVVEDLGKQDFFEHAV